MIGTIEYTISRFIKTFQSNPFDFLYESDIQGFVFKDLFEKLDDKIKILCHVFNDAHYNIQNNQSFIETHIVKTEYPTDKRFDIAIIDDRRNSSLPASNNQSPHEDFWRQPVKAGIELKYCQVGDSFQKKYEGTLNDIEKLREYAKDKGDGKFTGICLLFIQSYLTGEKMFPKLVNKGFESIEFNIHLEEDKINVWIITPRKSLNRIEEFEKV